MFISLTLHIRLFQDWPGFWVFPTFSVEFSHHLNTKCLKSEPLTSWTIFCPVFKWSHCVIRRNIQILDMLDHKADNFCLIYIPPFEIRTMSTGYFWTIWIPDWPSIQMVTVDIVKMKSVLLNVTFIKFIKHSNKPHSQPSIVYHLLIWVN